MHKVQKMKPDALFIIARAVAEACSRNIVKKEVGERIKVGGRMGGAGWAGHVATPLPAPWHGESATNSTWAPCHAEITTPWSLR